MIDKLYKTDLGDQTIYALINSVNDYPEIDINWVFNKYMNSRERFQAEDGNPHFICKSAREILMDLIPDPNDYPKSPNEEYNLDYDVLYWCGLIYNNLFFMYHIRGFKLLEYLPLKLLMKLYYPNHERSIITACENFFEYFIKDKDYQNYVIE